jgi:iron complex transport system substrate-binding protein
MAAVPAARVIGGLERFLAVRVLARRGEPTQRTLRTQSRTKHSFFVSFVSLVFSQHRYTRTEAGIAAVILLAAIASIALNAQPRRVVSIIPATTEMLFAMGAGDRLVAVGSYDRFPPEVEKLPRVGALLDPAVERILAMRPDLVILYSTQNELRTQLDRAQIPYFSYTHRGLADITETIRSLGARVGAGTQANVLAEAMERQLADMRARVANSSRPKTLLVFGREPGTLRNIDASGGVGFLHDMLETAGGANILSDVKQQSVQMTAEMVLTRAPDVIIELRYARGDKTDEADLRQWNVLASVPAVKNRRVYMLHGEEFVVPGPRVTIATERLAHLLHPELFP